MLLLKFNKNFEQEKRWILDIIFSEFLGLSYEIEITDSDVFIIETDAKSIVIDASFFQSNDKNWLKRTSLPTLPLALWSLSSEFKSNFLLKDVPVIYGKASLIIEENQIQCGIDIFGSAFFMLSRYEELVTQEQDAHQRFPATASTAYQSGFLDRPIVDEYTEILWGCINLLWPTIKRKKRNFKTIVSCDVDNPYANSVKNIKALPREVASALIKQKNAKLATSFMINALASRFGNYQFDPYNTFNWIMDENEKTGNKVTFYFITDNTAGKIDGCYSLKEPRIRSLMKQMADRGHEIGLHGSYNTYNNQKQLTHEANILMDTMSNLGITQESIGCRQHFLRWKTPDTARILDNAGFDYDTSLSFAGRPGFRCGTCHEYTMYDLQERKPLRIKQRPLIVMECSIIADRYLGLGYSEESFNLFKQYKDTCKRFSGNFALLWHNSHLTNVQDKLLYKTVM